MATPRRLPSRPAGSSYEIRRLLDWSADGTVVVALDSDGGVAVVDLDQWRLLHRVGRGHHARFVPGASVLAFAQGDAVHLVDMAAGWTRRSLAAKSVRTMAPSIDGKLLAVGGERDVVVWRLGGQADERLYEVAHQSAFELQLAVDGERLVAHVGQDPWGGAEQCLVWSARSPKQAPAACDLARLTARLKQPRRAALVADGGTLLVTGQGSGGRAELAIIDVLSGRVHRRVVVGHGHCQHVVATPDGRRIVLEVGESNAPQRLVVVDGLGASVQEVAGVEWGLGGLWLAPDGGTVLYDLGGDLWRLELRANRRTRALVLAAPPAPSAAPVAARPRGPLGVAEVKGPRGKRTRAVLMAGRAIDSYLPHWGQVAELRALAERRGDGACVVVAGDEVEYEPGAHAPAEKVHLRVVVGYPIADADADLGPRGPIDLVDLQAELERVATLDTLFWRNVSAILARTPAPFTAAQRRKSLSGATAAWYADIALDAADLLKTRDAVHLVPTGPLAHASLVAGVPGPVPGDDGAPEELLLWHQGQDSHQEPHQLGVRGSLLACADAHGLGTDRVEMETVAAQLATPGSALYLIARYD